MKQRVVLMVGVATATLILTTQHPAPASLHPLAQNPPCLTFPETGKTVCGAFLQYWQQHGGLSIFGYPISQPFSERSALNNKTYTVQYFERAVLEAHPENRAPYDVLLSQLGTYRFRSQYPQGDPGEPYTENLPLYADAQGVQIQHGNGSTEFDTTVTYTTKAKPAEVLAFYRGALLKDGWALGREESDYLQFYYNTHPSGDGGVPSLDVLVTAISPTQTEVRVRLLADG